MRTRCAEFSIGSHKCLQYCIKGVVRFKDVCAANELGIVDTHDGMKRKLATMTWNQ